MGWAAINAKAEHRPLAALYAHLIEQALELPRFRQLLHSAPKRSDAETVKEAGLDQLDPERLSELQTFISALQKFKDQVQLILTQLSCAGLLRRVKNLVRSLDLERRTQHCNSLSVPQEKSSFHYWASKRLLLAALV